VGGLEAYLIASSSVGALVTQLADARRDAEASARRVDVLQKERSRRFLGGVAAIDAGLRKTFRSLCKHGDASFEYASEPAILFAEGVSLAVKPPRAEWTRFESLSGGQQALVAVALTLALHELDEDHAAAFVLFDEIDAALDTHKVQALAEHVATRRNGQALFVSHRKELIEASGKLVGTYMRDGGTQSVTVSFA